MTKTYQQEALKAVREEHGQYFEALEKHPRLLVGVEVPRIGGEGMEVLQDTNDAREWQDAVKQILVDEVRGRAQETMDSNGDFLTTVHSSIELFQRNTDLIPGTKQFDVELATRFTKLAEPYELRVDGKLNGYSIPVQPIIESLRAGLTAERAASAAAPPAAGTVAAPAAPATGAPPQKQEEPPQAGITSKAGSSSEKEDFSTLFGTIGLPNLQI